MERIFSAILISFIISVVFAKPILFLLKKFKAKQTILHYVEAHKGKAGTPTMGGFLFILGIFVTTLFLTGKNNSLSLICLGVMLGYAVLGFLDDFIKIKYQQNEGLKPYQKIIGQVALATIIALFCYNSFYIGDSIVVPFINTELKLNIWVIPFIIFVFLAVTNSVNLTDGLDGLAGGVSLLYFVGFTFILSFYIIEQLNLGVGQALIEEYENLQVLCGAGIGSLISYLIFNSHPASVFMGDTGSLALGGIICSMAVVTKLELFIPLLGLLFVVSALSVVMQVLYYKKTKKRIFKMAPLHHHFEKSGMNETKIVAIYMIVTAMLVTITVLLQLVI